MGESTIRLRFSDRTLLWSLQKALHSNPIQVVVPGKLFSVLQQDSLVQVSAISITPLLERVLAILDHPEPINTQQLQQFLDIYTTSTAVS